MSTARARRLTGRIGGTLAGSAVVLAAGALASGGLEAAATSLAGAVLVGAVTLIVRGPRPREHEVHLLIDRLDAAQHSPSR